MYIKNYSRYRFLTIIVFGYEEVSNDNRIVSKKFAHVDNRVLETFKSWLYYKNYNRYRLWFKNAIEDSKELLKVF